MTFCPPNSWRTAKTQFRISPLTHHQQSKSHENKKLFQIEPIPFNINSISVVTLVLLWNPQFTPWKAGRTAGSIIYRLLAFKMAFPLSSKKQTLQTQRISSSSSWSQLHWSSEDPDYCLSEIECFESSEEQKSAKPFPSLIVINFASRHLQIHHGPICLESFTWLRLNSK